MAFTNDEIAQIIEEFFNTVGARQYIGARYVPIFGRKDEESIEWDGGVGEYEPLTVVLYQGNSYTSRQFVPVGVEITDTDFWANTGNYNAQVEQYRRDTAAALAAAQAAQDDIDTLLPKSGFDATNTVKAYIDALAALLPKSEFDETLTVKAYIDALGEIVSGVSEVANGANDKIDALTSYPEGIKVDSMFDETIGGAICIFKVPKANYDIDVIDPYGGHTTYERNYIYPTVLSQHLALTHNCNLIGVTMLDGNALHEVEADSQYFQVIGIKDDTYVLYTNKNTTCAQLIADGCKFGYGIWGVMVYNGVKIPVETIINPSDPDYDELVNEQCHVRDFIGDDDSYWYYGFICGRNSASIGGTWQQVQNFLYAYDADVNWYMIDGGGSTQCYVGDTNLVPYADSGLYPNYARSRFIFTTYKRKGE